MPFFSLSAIQTKDFQHYAKKNGLEIVGSFGEGITFELPSVVIIANGNRFVLPALELQNYPSTVVHLTEGLIRGQNLATIHGESLLPSGYCHSFNWVEENGFRSITGTSKCQGEIRQQIVVEDIDTDYYLIGLTSHFGHFFVDCLDRLLAIEELVGKKKNIKYVVNYELIPQIKNIFELLGTDINDNNLLFLKQDLDYRIKNLNIISLKSAKPAISWKTFLEFRRRVLSKMEKTIFLTKGIYVGRKQINKRKIINQAEIESYLNLMEITAFYPEDHSFVKTAEVFNSVEVVVIVIGSSKFNLVFPQFPRHIS